MGLCSVFIVLLYYHNGVDKVSARVDNLLLVSSIDSITHAVNQIVMILLDEIYSDQETQVILCGLVNLLNKTDDSEYVHEVSIKYIPDTQAGTAIARLYTIANYFLSAHGRRHWDRGA